MYQQSEKNLLNSKISSTCSHNMANFGPLTADIGSGVRAAQQISTGFASCLCYCSDVVHRRPTKLCTFGRLLRWYTMYTFSAALAPTEFCLVQNSLCPSIAFAYIGSVTARTALQLWASAKLCGVVHAMELRNFRRGCRLYSAGRPSRWASAHILVLFYFIFIINSSYTMYGCCANNK